ncbi:MAG: hypothetical protein Ct9H300mP12_03020 [Acidimicrobiales bacterium]|nr:MAG: hypothetical protein Ct9H300mP12_03020 [Acidimicrobiales bacterium]
MVLRAIDDPTDDLAVVAALRTPYLGCGDDDLARWRVHHGGSWNHQADQPVSDRSETSWPRVSPGWTRCTGVATISDRPGSSSD